MKKDLKIAVVNTVTNASASIHAEFGRQMPDCTIFDVIDTTMVHEIIRTIDPSPALIGKLANYYMFCENYGCDAVLNACSSISVAYEIAKQTVSIPVFQIDRPMGEEAVRTGKKIALISTAISTVKPSTLSIENAAKRLGKDDVTVTSYFCDGAHKAYIMNGDKETHDRIVLEKAKEAAKDNDVLVLAQGSMAGLADSISEFGKPVLTSPYGGIKQIKDYFEKM